MHDLGFKDAENNETYWIGCQRTGGLDEAVLREEYDMIAMAWRSIYAESETVKAQMDDKTLNLKRAIWTWARLALSRVIKHTGINGTNGTYSRGSGNRRKRN